VCISVCSARKEDKDKETAQGSHAFVGRDKDSAAIGHAYAIHYICRVYMCVARCVAALHPTTE
jgi:hypothetical protein